MSLFSWVAVQKNVRDLAAAKAAAGPMAVPHVPAEQDVQTTVWH
jgi:hypothetical protein